MIEGFTNGASRHSTCWLLIGGQQGWRECSLDLRERVVAAVAGGQSCRPVAKTFMVSVASVVKGWSQRRPAVSGRRPVLRVVNKDAASLHPVLSHKTISDTVLASVTPDDPELQATGRDVVAGLVGIAPKTSVEAMLATR